jgi:hypothetical protein
MRRTGIVMAAGLGLAALSLWLVRGTDSTFQAREAFHRGNYAAAVRGFQDAAADCHDLPALAANQAAALFRMDRYDDADGRYRMAASGEDELRAAKAAYDRGNCALRQACPTEGAADEALLDQAAEQFRACLTHESNVREGDKVFDDARHNLELTKLLRQPQSAEGKADETAHNAAAGNSQSGVRPENEGNSRLEDRGSSAETAPVTTESRKPSSLLAALTARADDSDYLCPD